eukprot:COSAG02_NODE_860_length_16430_cov_39.045741_3_plen_173_part_00
MNHRTTATRRPRGAGNALRGGRAALAIRTAAAECVRAQRSAGRASDPGCELRRAITFRRPPPPHSGGRCAPSVLGRRRLDECAKHQHGGLRVRAVPPAAVRPPRSHTPDQRGVSARLSWSEQVRAVHAALRALLLCALLSRSRECAARQMPDLPTSSAVARRADRHGSTYSG